MTDNEDSDEPAEGKNKSPEEQEQDTENAEAASDEETAGEPESEDTEDDRSPPKSAEEPLLTRLLAFNAEDWLVISLVAAIILVALVSYFPLGALIPGSNPTAGLNPYCVEAADSVETNLSKQYGETECKCLPPTNPDDPTLGDKANNTYTLQCKYSNGQVQNFEIWVPNEEFQNQTNESYPRVQ